MDKTKLMLRSLGFVTSLLLTLAAYFIIIRPELFHLKTGKAVVVILNLAFLQAAAQFIFFLDLWREKGPLWNLAIFFSTLAMIFIVVAFSIWIMDHLNYNMIP